MSIQLISRLDIVFGSYKFSLPVDFYPDYRNLGAPVNVKYGFDVALHVKSTAKIQKLSMPPNSACQRMARGTQARIICKKPAEELLLYYQSTEAMKPQLLYAEDPKYPNEIAVSGSLVPTFEDPPAPGAEQMQVKVDEEPVAKEIS